MVYLPANSNQEIGELRIRHYPDRWAWQFDPWAAGRLYCFSALGVVFLTACLVPADRPAIPRGFFGRRLELRLNLI